MSRRPPLQLFRDLPPDSPRLAEVSAFLRQGDIERKAQSVPNPRDKWGLRFGAPDIQPAAASHSADKLTMQCRETRRPFPRSNGGSTAQTAAPFSASAWKDSPHSG